MYGANPITGNYDWSFTTTGLEFRLKPATESLERSSARTKVIQERALVWPLSNAQSNECMAGSASNRSQTRAAHSGSNCRAPISRLQPDCVLQSQRDCSHCEADVRQPSVADQQSQRDCILQPRVATKELPWV